MQFVVGVWYPILFRNVGVSLYRRVLQSGYNLVNVTVIFFLTGRRHVYVFRA
jgi:hypothetical protein